MARKLIIGYIFFLPLTIVMWAVDLDISLKALDFSGIKNTYWRSLDSLTLDLVGTWWIFWVAFLFFPQDKKEK